MSDAHVDPAVLQELAGEPRATALRHLASCPDCRARVAADSPESLFALLRLEPESPQILDAVAAGVSRRLEDARPSWVEALRERGMSRTVAGLAAAAAVVVGAVLVSRAPRPAAVPVAAAEPGRAGVTLVEPAPAAQVIDLTVGGTQFVMIFDPEMKL